MLSREERQKIDSTGVTGVLLTPGGPGEEPDTFKGIDWRECLVRDKKDLLPEWSCRFARLEINRPYSKVRKGTRSDFFWMTKS